MIDLDLYTNTNPVDTDGLTEEKKKRIVETIKRFHRSHIELDVLTVLKSRGDISSELMETEKKTTIKRLEDMKHMYYKIKGNPKLKRWDESNNFESLMKVWKQ
jgi:hypothetical protein